MVYCVYTPIEFVKIQNEYHKPQTTQTNETEIVKAGPRQLELRPRSLHSVQRMPNNACRVPGRLDFRTRQPLTSAVCEGEV
eukprot:2222-Pyramimonas_sp.AAC.2